MKVKSLDLNNKIFITEDNEEYPILFDIDDFIHQVRHVIIADIFINNLN